MEMSLSSFARDFLECVLGEPLTQKQLDLFLALARRADYEKLTKGDFVIPLTAPKLKEMAGPNTPFGNFIHNPTEDNIKMLDRILETCRLPVAKVSVQNKILRIHLDRAKVMKNFLPRVMREGNRYGSNVILKQVPIVLTHYATWREDSDLKYLRGVKLVNHITRILEFCGAEVDVSDKLMSGMQTQSRNEFGMVCCEECDPEAACPVSSEPQVSKNPQNPPQLSVMPCTPADAASCCVVNEECGKGHVEPKCDNMMREKTPWIEGSLHAPSKRQADCRIKALGVSSENKYVMCAPHNEEMTRETQAPHSCVSERLELSEKDNTERQANEVKKEGHSADKTQDASHKQQAIKPSEVKKFVITDSMKGVQDTGWVYQYFGVVDAKTGRKWDGSVSEYCRMLTEELKQTSEMRYKEVDGPEWTAFLEEQTQRCLTLQLLMPSHLYQLRVEVDGNTHNTKEAAFMLYNYARLCSIFDHFEQCVKQGAVAPLPPIDDVDFSLLRYDEEWELVWIYILRWPEILEDIALGVKAGTKKPKSNQVIRFLYSLSHRWSEYYSRHKVLPESFLPHLLPLMYARLHLLCSINTLMRACFSVLGVTTLPSQM